MAQYEKREILLRIMTEEGCKTKAAFAEKIGVSPAVVCNWLARDSFPADKLITALPHISPLFIRQGVEPYLRNAPQPTPHPTEPVLEVQDPSVNNANLDRLLAVIEKQQNQIDRLISILEKGDSVA